MALDSSLNLTDPREFDPDTTIIGTLWCIRGVELGWEVIFESAPVDASGNVVEAESELIDAFGAANGQWLVIRYNDPSETRAYRVIVEGAGCDQSCPSDWVKAQPTEIPLPLPECDDGDQRPSGNDLVLWWKLDEDHVEPGPWHLAERVDDPFACGVTGDTTERVYLDSSGRNNHGFHIGPHTIEYDASLASGATPGVSNRGFGTPSPALDIDNEAQGSLYVDPSPTIQSCEGGGQRSMEDFWPVHDITVIGWYRPWLWTPDPDLERWELDEQQLWGRWSFSEGDLTVGQTAEEECTLESKLGGFHVQLEHLPDPPYTPFITAHIFFVGMDTTGVGPEIRYEVNWTGHDIEDYSARARSDAILGDHWMFLAQRHSPIQPDGTIQIDFFTGNGTTGELSKLCCTDLMDGSDIDDACHAPQIIEDDTPLHTYWALGTTSVYEGDRLCGLHSLATARMHFDDHRRYNSALTEREIRWLFNNPGKA